MKKILFIAGVISFNFAYSQDNDSFDVQKYLKMKSEKDKKTDFKKTIPKIHFTPRGNTGIVLSYHFPDTFQSQTPGKLSHVLPNGNKVYLLPQDNMPCIVPDLSEYNNNMGLVNPDMPQYNIPNPAYPPQNKFERFTPEKLKELQELLNKRSKNTN